VQWIIFGATLAGAYLLGSIPTGFLLARWKGIDIRTAGSGNIGATNAFRVLGKKIGSLVLVIDALKGVMACRPLAFLGFQQLMKTNPDSPLTLEIFMLACGITAILGHNFTCWLKFKGGKGIATTAGVLLGLAPLALLISLAVWILMLRASKYVSVASITAALVMPVAVWGTGGSPPMIWTTSALGILAVLKHRANIKRLLNGTENRVGSKSQSSK
jgi:glycerol-3-phosphate acyltransferase PlsY